MYTLNQNLPKNCPSHKAIEIEKVVYRIIAEKAIGQDDFIAYAQLYPENEVYQKMCDAYAISFFNNLNAALKAYDKARDGSFIKKSKYIAKLQMKPNLGKNRENLLTGHINTWLYTSTNHSSFSVMEILNIEDLKKGGNDV